MNMNINGIRPAEEYFKEEQARLRLNVSDEEYDKLRDELGITRKERAQRIRAQPKSKKPAEVEPPLKYNLDYPFMG